MESLLQWYIRHIASFFHENKYLLIETCTATLQTKSGTFMTLDTICQIPKYMAPK